MEGKKLATTDKENVKSNLKLTNKKLRYCENNHRQSQPVTVKSGIIAVGINIVTSPIAFLAGPILINMRDVDVLQK